MMGRAELLAAPWRWPSTVTKMQALRTCHCARSTPNKRRQAVGNPPQASPPLVPSPREGRPTRRYSAPATANARGQTAPAPPGDWATASLQSCAVCLAASAGCLPGPAHTYRRKGGRVGNGKDTLLCVGGSLGGCQAHAFKCGGVCPQVVSLAWVWAGLGVRCE